MSLRGVRFWQTTKQSPRSSECVSGTVRLLRFARNDILTPLLYCVPSGCYHAQPPTGQFTPPSYPSLKGREDSYSSSTGNIWIEDTGVFKFLSLDGRGKVRVKPRFLILAEVWDGGLHFIPPTLRTEPIQVGQKKTAWSTTGRGMDKYFLNLVLPTTRIC